MTPFMIPDIAQLKQAEINALTDAVARLQREVVTRQTVIDNLSARAQHFQDRLTEADTARATALATLNQAQSAQSAANGLAGACLESHHQVTAVDESLTNVADAEADLLRQLTFVINLLEKAGQLANKQKASNPLIPDTLIDQLSRAAGDCANVVALALVAQDSCLTASAGLSVTRGTLDLARSQADHLRHDLQPGKHHEAGVLGHLERLYQRSADHYNAALAVSTNATAQLDHANAALATAKARLASLQAGLAAVMAVDAKAA
ncbi:hypothetical protein CHU95_05275 [Niveispirillum lacus]|uniref:Uncharacterized protein n=1 Tax=Niveispirillum lacus TaxID=1981099 RepID=A0A255Z437_9PROT|nr:hypothetical protein [Niveispirillum lacus]OYQ36202.1 hypothetical protein CHU95_05275 [Niveispirillum lacus]